MLTAGHVVDGPARGAFKVRNRIDEKAVKGTDFERHHPDPKSKRARQASGLVELNACFWNKCTQKTRQVLNVKQDMPIIYLY